MFVDRPVGIDLGTTNSEIALLDPSERDILIYADRFGRRVIPSAVAWDPKASAYLVGHPARQRRGRAPAPVESIKRKMGQQVKVKVGPHELSPEEISSKILSELRDRMREHLSAKAPPGVDVRVDRAVITVPAYFDAPQVEATRRAGELAGLHVAGILQEPTAAAIYHTWKNRLGDGHFLIYDLGGGTFDVSILRCVGGEYQVLAIDGDNYLGGDDFDRRFAERLRSDMALRGYALDLDVLNDEDDRRRFIRIVHLAQEIKELLSTSEVVPVSKHDVVDDKNGENVTYDAEVGREHYEKSIADLVGTTIECCHRALARSKEVASVGLGDIDHVVLVGGSTRVPLVIRKVIEEICAKSKSQKPLQDEVDTCVALGAAIHAAQLGGLRIGEPDKKAQVLFTTPLVAQSPKIKIGLRVEEAPEGSNDLVITSNSNEVLARASIPEKKDTLVRVEAALGGEPDNAVSMSFRGGNDQSLAELPFALYRGDVRPRASSLSRPSVVAKDIALEVLRAGRRDRRVLIARGTGLPAETAHRFFTADQSGAVVLRLLQNRLPIKTLLVSVPKELPVGTPVELTIRCDEAMRMEARAVVAGQELWASVEPSREAQFDPRGNVEVLLEDAEGISRSLWGSLGQAYRREADTLMAGIREVIATDPDKLTALCERLQRLVDEFKGGPSETLVPPMHRFESELDDLRRIVYRSSGMLMGMDRVAWDNRINDIQVRALAAYEAGDAGAWRRVYNEVLALYETASQEEFSNMRLDDPAYITRRYAGVGLYAKRIEAALLDFVPSATDDVRAMQLAERDRLLGTLREKVMVPHSKLKVEEGGDTAEIRRKLESMSSEISRIDSALERIPSLGLVTERGGN